MKRRAIALALAVLIALQALPTLTFAEEAAGSVTSNTITAQYYAVRFAVEEGDAPAARFYDSAIGAVLGELPEAPEAEGKAFVGWYQGEEPVDETTPVTADMVLTARYEELSVKEEPSGEEDAQGTLLSAANARLEQAGAALTASGNGNKENSFSVQAGGTYLSVSVAGTYKGKQEPSLQAAAPAGLEGVTVLEAWNVENIKNNTKLSLTVSVTALPALAVGESLALYSMNGAGLDALLRENLREGDSAELALAARGATGVALVKVDASGEEEQDELADGKVVWANEHVYLTGKLPGNAVVVATPVTARVEGEEVLAAYDISIYANENQRSKGNTWQPADKKVQVGFYDESFGEGRLHVYHFQGDKAELVDTVRAEEGWVTFEADSFSVYAVSSVIEKTVSIAGSTYKISVRYDSGAGIPDGAELAVVEQDGAAYLEDTARVLHWTEDDTVFYTKYLDISIVKDGVEIEPKTAVEVTVELLDVTDGAEALQVVHFGADGAEEVESTATAGGVVTFETRSFSTFGFGSILTMLLSWSADLVDFSVMGFTSLLQPVYTATNVALEEGLEAISAYTVRTSGLLGSLAGMWIKVALGDAFAIGGERESVSIYGIESGALGELLSENVQESAATVSLGRAEGFVVVRDSGYRHKTFALEGVRLDGMMPKAADATAEDVAEEYASFGEEGTTTLAAYDISITSDGEEYEPDAEHPVQVEISGITPDPDKALRLWHVRDDGTAEEINEFTLEEGVLRFDAAGFSDYVVTETTLKTTITTDDGMTYEISVTYASDSAIPMEGTELLVSEIREGDDGYAGYIARSADKVGARAENIEFARAFDIRIVDGNDHEHIYEPAGDVDVSIRLIGAALDDYANVGVLHFVESGEDEAPAVFAVDSTAAGETIDFTTDSFSVYVVAGYVLETTIELDGQTYKVTATYDDHAGIPGDAKLEVSEVLIEDEGYLSFLEDTASALGVASGDLGYLRMLDIAIVGEDGAKYTPGDWVQISVELIDEVETGDLRVVHFGETTEELPARTEGDTVRFETESFSLFSFVDLTLVQNIVDAVFGGTYTDTVYENDDITVSGRMPRGAIVEVNPATVEIEDEDILVAYDIKIYAGPITRALGLAWQPTDGALSVRVKSDALNGGGSVSVYHMADETSEPEFLTVANIVDSSVEFEAESFSIYPIADGSGENARIAYRFWYYNTQSKQYEEITTQFYRYKDVRRALDKGEHCIHEPAIPGIDSEEMVTIFDGWYLGGFIGNSDTPALEQTATSIEALNTELEGKTQEQFIEGTYYDIFAALKSAYYITYVDVNTEYIRGTDLVLQAESGDTIFTVRDDVTITKYQDNLKGWRLLEEITDTSSTLYEAGKDYTITGNITLAPVIEGGYWLVFDDNDPVDDGTGKMVSGGATYTPPVFYLNNASERQPTVRPAMDPEWVGYSFEGWYADAAGTEEFTFGGVLTANTTVYAKWTPAENSYTVIVWKQRGTDAVDAKEQADYDAWLSAYRTANPGAADTQISDAWNEVCKHYDFVSSEVISAKANGDPVKTGDYIILDPAYTRIYGADGTSTESDKSLFVYNQGNTTQYIVVKASGGSVFNVYYDRVPVTMNFYTWRNGYVYTETTAETGAQYGIVGNDYVPLSRRDGDAYTYTYSYSPAYTATTSDTIAPEYGVIDGEYRQLTRRASYGYTYYAYTPTTGDTGTQYALIGEEYVPLTRIEHTTYTWTPRYTYTSSTATDRTMYGVVNNAYVSLTRDQTRYYITSTNTAWPGTRYKQTTSTAWNTYYGIVNGQLVQLTGTLTWDGWYWTYNGQEYTGPRYAESSDNNNTYAFVDGQMLGVTRASGNFYFYSYNGEVYSTVRNNTTYGGTRYTRVNYNGAALPNGTIRYKQNGSAFEVANDDSGTQYYYDGTGYVELSRGSGVTYTWEYTDSTGTHTWEGARYARPGNTSTSYGGQRYTRAGANWWEYQYTASDAQDTGMYGVDARGGHVSLDRSSSADSYAYYDSTTGQLYTGARYYAPNNNPVSYTGTRYTMPGGVPHVTTENAVSGLYGLDSNGVYRPIDGLATAQQLWTYEDPATHEPKPYTGTRYVRTDSPENSWQLYRSYTGLYGSTYGDNGYTWPTEYDWYTTGNGRGGNANTSSGSHSVGGTHLTFTDAFILGTATSENYYGNDPAGGSVPIRFNKQNLDLTTYATANTVMTSGGSFSISDKYDGFKPVAYSINGGAKRTLPDAPDRNGYYATGISYSSSLDIYFDRISSPLSFFQDPDSSAEPVTIDVAYGKSLEEYSDQYPGEKLGHYFVGWYADRAHTVPFDFTQTMPAAGVPVFGYWRIERVRVIFVPNGENVYIDPAQVMSFRLDYNETISGSMLEAATRPGYAYGGWYTDPEFTNKYKFGSPVNTKSTGVDRTYQTAARWAATRENYGDNVEKNENVRGVLVLYAKWTQDTSQSGVNVVYDAGSAALYDGMGYVSTTVPVDPHLYPDGSYVTVGAAPKNYSPLYDFAYWEIVDSNGDVVTVTNDHGVWIDEFEPGFTFNVNWVSDEDAYALTYVEGTDQVLIKTIRLRAHYTKNADAAEYFTTITYDGDTFHQRLYAQDDETVLQGMARDGSHRLTITLDKEINETIVLPTEADFYLDGYTLVGWSFFEGSYAEQIAAGEQWNAEHTDLEEQIYVHLADLDGDGAPETTVHFKTAQRVGTDNLFQSDPNSERNTLYAMWLPKTYTVTVRQVVEDGVAAAHGNSAQFRYTYRSGAENAMPAGVKELFLDGTASQEFTTLSSDAATKYHYYGLEGHVFAIDGPAVPDNADYAVRVSATVLRDDGTTETLPLNASGNYEILGDVTITYTYALKVPVTLEKRDLADKTALTGARFTLTPIEWDSVNQTWQQAGSAVWTYDLTSSYTQTIRLQEGVYRVDEIQAPTNYAAMSEPLRLTVVKNGAFSLLTTAGTAVSENIARLTGTDSHTLTVYDRPIREVTIGKTVEGTDVTGNGKYTFLVQLSLEGSELKGYDTVGDGLAADTTDSDGMIEFTLGDSDAKTLRIPWGSVITVTENEYAQFRVSAASRAGVADAETESDRVFRCTVVADDTITFTNTNRLLRVTNTVTGPMGDIHKPFNYTLSGLTAGKRYDFRIDGASQYMFATAEGNVHFVLKHGQTMAIALPDGAYTVSEDEEMYYTTTVKTNGVEPEETYAKEIALSAGAAETAIEFINYHPAVSPTGLTFRVAPYIWALGAGAALVLLAARTRRRKEEE